MQEQSYSCVCLVKADGWKRRSFKNLLWMNDDRDHFTYVHYFLLFCQVFETLLKIPITFVSQRLFLKKIHVSHMLQLQKHI